MSLERRSRACPFCQVAPGEPCMGADGRPRASVHVERWRGVLAATRTRAAKLQKAVKEGAIRKLLDARVKAYGGETRAVKWLGRSHAPDVLALFPLGSLYVQQRGAWSLFGHPFVETKRPGKAATEAQAREHKRMEAAGCTVLVITNEAELDAWLPPL